MRRVLPSMRAVAESAGSGAFFGGRRHACCLRQRAVADLGEGHLAARDRDEVGFGLFYA
jgi:hypothetical protein